MKHYKLVFILLFTFSLSVKSQTIIRLYNKTDKLITVCYASYNQSIKGWVSKGWYWVKPFQSSDLNLGTYTGDVYIYGKQDGLLADTKWGKGASFCINAKDAFEIQFADKANCSKKEEFSKLTVKRGVTNWNFNSKN